MYSVTHRYISTYGFMFLALFFLVGCAEVDSPEESTSSSLTPTQKVWIAFLQYHAGKSIFIRFKGVSFRVTEQRDGTAESTKFAPEIDNPEAVILGSDDRELIKLHEHLKSSERAISDSPEAKRWAALTNQKLLLDRVYQDVVPQDPAPASTEQRLSDLDDEASYNARMAAPRAEADRQNAKLQLARQKDPEARKVDTGTSYAEKAFSAVKVRYEVPSDELLVVLRRYMPSGSKGWGEPMSSDNGLGGGAQFSTWVY